MKPSYVLITVLALVLLAHGAQAQSMKRFAGKGVWEKIDGKTVYQLPGLKEAFVKLFGTERWAQMVSHQRMGRTEVVRDKDTTVDGLTVIGADEPHEGFHGRILVFQPLNPIGVCLSTGDPPKVVTEWTGTGWTKTTTAESDENACDATPKELLDRFRRLALNAPSSAQAKASPVQVDACSVNALDCASYPSAGESGWKLHDRVNAARKANHFPETICLALKNVSNQSDTTLAGASHFEMSHAWEGLGCHDLALSAIEASLTVRPKEGKGWKETCSWCRRLLASRPNKPNKGKFLTADEITKLSSCSACDGADEIDKPERDVPQHEPDVK